MVYWWSGKLVEFKAPGESEREIHIVTVLGEVKKRDYQNFDSIVIQKIYYKAQSYNYE